MITTKSYAAQAQALVHFAPECGPVFETLCVLHAVLGMHMDACWDADQDASWLPETERLENQLFGLCLDLLEVVRQELPAARTPEQATWLQKAHALSWRLGYALARDEKDAALIHGSAE